MASGREAISRNAHTAGETALPAARDCFGDCWGNTPRNDSGRGRVDNTPCNDVREGTLVPLAMITVLLIPLSPPSVPG